MARVYQSTDDLGPGLEAESFRTQLPVPPLY